MDKFAEGTRRKIRFITSKGMASIEDIWTLKQPVIANLLRDAAAVLKESAGDDESLAFLNSNKRVNKDDQLRFDILKEIYIIKQTEEEEATTKASVKEHNEKILALIRNKQEESLNNKSEEELLAMLK